MLGTSLLREISTIEEGKTCVIFTSALFTLFSSMVYACSKSTGHARKSLFSQTNFAFAFKLSNYSANFSGKSVRASLICLGLNLSGCREIFSSWPQPVETELLFVWMIFFPWLLVFKDRKRFWRAQWKLLTTSSSVICFYEVSKIFLIALL